MPSHEKTFMFVLEAWKAGRVTPTAVMSAAIEFARANVSPECAQGKHKECSFPERCEHRAHYARRKDRYRQRGQSKEAQKARLDRGLCPVHGVVLLQIGVVTANGKQCGDEVGCSRKDCDFTKVIEPGDKLWEILHARNDDEEKSEK